MTSSPDEFYPLSEHRHRYACWCAARAATRGLAGATNRAVRLALEGSSLPNILTGPTDVWPQTSEDFDSAHLGWCGAVLEGLHDHGVTGATFGRAAKIVAIYIKTLVVCGGHQESPLAAVAHPPVDRVLLQALACQQQFPVAARSRWRRTSWTALSEEEYVALIEDLREAGLDRGGFWRAEWWWSGDG